LLGLALRWLAALLSPLRLRFVSDRQCSDHHEGREETPS